MRIAISTLIDDPKQKSGCGQIVTNLLSEFRGSKAANEYFLITFKDDPSTYVRKNENFIEIQSGLYAAGSIKRILWNQFVLPYHMLKNKIDLLHIPVPDLFMKACPTVVSIEDLAEYRIKNKYSPLRMLYRKAILPRIARKADHIITVSESSKKDIVELLGTSPDKISVIYHGINKNFRPLDREGAFGSIREKYRVPEEYILYVGRIMHPSKNIVRIIRAFHRLRSIKGIRHKLVLVGKNDWGHETVHKTIRELRMEEEVLFMGYVPDSDLPFFYNCAAAFVFPSLYEGFGLPVIEAMACGLPVMTSNVSSMPEVAGDAALLVNPYDLNEIENGIYSLLSDDRLRQDLIRKGIERSKLFSWCKAGEKYMKIYASVLDNLKFQK